MTVDLQTLADREAIKEIRHRFGAALDTRDWQSFASVFTEDAVGDFTSFGVPASEIPKLEIVRLFQAAFALPAAELRTQQLIGNFLIETDGDRATSSSYLQGHHHLPGHQGGEEVVLRARYDDQLVRSPDGWKIARTTLTIISITGNAAILAA